MLHGLSGSRARNGAGSRRITVGGDGGSRLSTFATQYQGSEGAPPRYVVLGLDFGTAFTKVVIADKSDSYAVRLRRNASGIDAYLLPGLLTLSPLRGYALAERRSATGVLDNLKLALLDRPQDKRALADAAAFLSLVLQKARTEFMRAEREIFGRSRLDWHLNIGLPAENWESATLVAAFRAIAWAAWTLSVSTVRPNPAKALVAVQDAISLGSRAPARYAPMADRLLAADQVTVIPEVVAETVSYARSPMRNDGLHMLVDVGAGTLDVNVFKLFVYDDADRRTLVAPRVLPLGSVYLARHRMKQLRDMGLAIGESAARLFDEYGGWRTREALESELGLTAGTIADLDGPFQSRVGTALYDALLKVRRDYGRILHDWTRPVPTFVAGGGSKDLAYRERFERLSRDLNEIGQGGLSVRGLPVPERFKCDGVPNGQFHRLAVAYGLAQDPLDLGDFVPPSQLPPALRPAEAPDWRESFVGAELT